MDDKVKPDDPNLIAALREWLTQEGIDFFTEVYEKHGKLNAVWMDGSIPHPVHFREGMQVRNKLRELTNFAWCNEEYESRWEECVLRAIGKL